MSRKVKSIFENANEVQIRDFIMRLVNLEEEKEATKKRTTLLVRILSKEIVRNRDINGIKPSIDHMVKMIELDNIVSFVFSMQSDENDKEVYQSFLRQIPGYKFEDAMVSDLNPHVIAWHQHSMSLIMEPLLRIKDIFNW